MTGLTLDAGALIALERNDRDLVTLLKVALDHELEIAVPAGALAQVWRNGRRQARLSRFLATPEVEIEILDDIGARSAGQLCGVRHTDDVVDASVVLCAKRRGHRIVTSDPDDLSILDDSIELVVC